ncbi:hypothetical protein HMPREF0880_00975 [Yokenella regensburgei ATCC 43003]|nr:hypothetical protein HMPREF0880_00975 [Yokenella regensburgei ATCC 43003]
MTFLLHIICQNVLLYKYTVIRIGRDFMVGEHFSRTQQKWACVQFIAEVSLIANCKPSDLKLALTLIADLANSENIEPEKEIFYKAE